MVTIAVINQKGGVGKSTTVYALGAGLTLKGYKVLYVDLDAQGNLTYALSGTNGSVGVLDALLGSSKVKDVVQRTSGGDLIASTPNLARADTLLTETGKEYRLREALSVLSNLYDFCIIDTPPSLSILTVNALTACDEVIIPAQADVFSLQGISQLKGTIDAVKKYCNPSLKVTGIILTHFNKRVIIRREIAELLEQTATQLNTRLFNTRIRECTAIVESQATKKDIYKYAPRSNASKDYQALVDEILEKMMETEGHGKENI